MGGRFYQSRPRRPGRRPQSRNKKHRFLIVCEGENTEPQYLKQFAKQYRQIVDVVIEPARGVPKSVVEAAIRLRDEAKVDAQRFGNPDIAYDSVWCVFDVDEHPKLDEAMNEARGNGVELAVSNPCFELWLLLHHRESPGMQHRHHVQAMLKTFVPDYDKSVDFKDYEAGYTAAVRRAQALDRLAESINDPRMNPLTGVYRLTEKIAAEGSPKSVPDR